MSKFGRRGWGNHPLLPLLLAAYVEELPLSRYSSPTCMYMQPAQRGGLCFGVVDVHSTCCLPQPNFNYNSSVLADGGTGCGGKWDIDRLISIIDVRVARQFFFFGLHSTPTSSTSIALVPCRLWVWLVPFLWPTN